MGNEFRYSFMVKIRRLLLMTSVAFALILFAQYLKLSYGNALSFLFSTGKFQSDASGKFQGWDSFGDLNSSIDLAHSSVNATNVKVADEVSGVVGHEKSGVGMNGEDDFDAENLKKMDNAFDDGIDFEDEFSSDVLLETNENSTDHNEVKDSGIMLENAQESELRAMNSTSTSESSQNYNIVTPPFTSSPSYVQSDFNPLRGVDSNASNYVNSPSPSTFTTGLDAEDVLLNHGKPEIMSGDMSYHVNNSVISSISAPNGRLKKTTPAVMTVSEMNNMLLRSHVSYRSVKPKWSLTVDKELRNARSLIENAPTAEIDPLFDTSLYQNFSAFRRSYELMEQFLKVYVYTEGERPIFHQPPLKGIYASEGWFMKQLKSSKRFLTKNAKKAHLFYLPFSSRELEISLYVPGSHSRDNMVQYLRDHVNLISNKYNFWNRTRGSDHFLVACHDWAPAETKKVMSNCIRALCNSDIKEGFQFGKDASLPETYVRSAQNPLRQLGGKPPSQRHILAFFAGNMHGYVRPILLNFWENKDPDMKIFGRLGKVKGGMSYTQYMKSSKYCICARGYEVNSPRVVEAIFFECVPVIISDNFIPPFFETLNWESFAVFVLEKDIPNLKNILVSIPKKKYRVMQQRVKQVQQHFLWHSGPVKYDVFHMILHSIWYNRVFRT